MSDPVKVAQVDEFEDGDRKLIEIDGVEIGIFHVDGQYHAILNNCPHQNGPIATGVTKRKVVADVPETGEWVDEEYDPDSMVVRCPFHGWGFDLESGDNVADPENAPGVPTFDLIVEGGDVLLDV